MPNLFVATGIFHPEPGGPATYLHEILPALQSRGWDVRLQTYGTGETDSYPYPVLRVPRQTYPLRLLNYARAARASLKWADVVYTHTIDLPLIGKTAPRVIKIVGDQAWERCIRKGWVSPAEDIDTFQHKSYNGLVAQQKRSRSNQVRRMDSVIVPSDYLKQMVQGWGIPPERIHVVYNALPAMQDDRLSQVEARQLHGLGYGPLLLAAGRLEPWKGIQHIIAALKHVPDVQLLIAGDGPMREQWQAMAQSLGARVQFLGRLRRSVLYEYMAAADYFMLYSGYEGLPHSVLESLRVGTPVIASQKGGNVEVVQHGVNGLLVPYVDVKALAATIETAFITGQRAALAQNAHIDPARFSFDNMVSQTDAILKQFA